MHKVEIVSAEEKKLAYTPVFERNGQAISITIDGTASFGSANEARNVCESYHAQKGGASKYAVVRGSSEYLYWGYPGKGWYEKAPGYSGTSHIFPELTPDRLIKVADWGG